MVQRRASSGGVTASRASSRNPFDSDEEEASPRAARYKSAAPAYTNPFDEVEEKVKSSAEPFKGQEGKNSAEKNPFDDEAMWNRRHESSGSHRVASASRSSPQDDAAKHSDETKPRRRDRVKEKISSVSGDVASSVSRGVDLVKPRSKNLMGDNTTNNNRQLLFDDDRRGPNATIQNEQRKFAHARIERGLKAGDSLEEESVQELEDYAVQKAEETTAATYKALQLAEEIKDSATNTSIMLHEQGHQITRTHDTAVNIDHELSRGEKLLGSLGGIFSKTWKPKKARNITGPMLSRGDSFKRKAYGMEQRAALGLNRSNSRGKTRHTAAVADSSGSQAQSRIKDEFKKQDDALGDLSNVLCQLKEMSMDMGTEIGRQNEAIGHLEGDIGELGSRVKGANDRGRKLLGR